MPTHAALASDFRACSFAPLIAGKSKPIRTAMMAITVRSSTNVKAWER
jgi:hypothetical protein